MKLTDKLNEMIQQNAYRVTSKNAGHHHEYRVDANGNGATSFTHDADEHQHAIKDNKVIKSEGHTHELPTDKISEE